MRNSDLNELLRLSQLTKADMYDKKSALDLMRRYFAINYVCCLTCDNNVQSMFKTIKGLCEKNTRGQLQKIKEML